MNERLDAAYRATSYFVDGPDGRFALRIDEPAPLLDDLLVRHDTRCWAFLTACNPGSTALAPEGIERREQELERIVAEAGYPTYPGQGVGDDGAWPAEASLLIVGITTEDALILGRVFGQRAILAGEIAGPARLLWL